MKKISVREVEALKPTAAVYLGNPCCDGLGLAI
jgi:hypothetical protein